MSSGYYNAYFWNSRILSSLRKALDFEEFDEILPAILSERYEPGARHSIAVLDDRSRPSISIKTDRVGASRVSVEGERHYYLPVSHCVEKQLSLEYLSRVYCIAPCVRLLMEGEEYSGRHLYTFFQAEIEWRTESVSEVYTTTEAILRKMAEDLLAKLSGHGRIDPAAFQRLAGLARVPYPQIRFSDARALVSEVAGTVNPHADGDLTHAEEFALSNHFETPFWLTDYPDGVRDSLYRQSQDGTFLTYDLVLPGGYGELATGGLRPDQPQSIIEQATKLGETPHHFYADWKARTRMQTGGIGIGVERLVRYCAGVESVLDLLVAHDQGPNASILASQGEHRAVKSAGGAS